MNKYLKFIVSFLAVLILILFSITIFVIIKKYSHVEDKYIENIEIFPELNENESVQSFNINGNKILTLVNESKSAGKHVMSLNLSKFSSGMYFCKLTTPTFSKTKKIILIH